MINWYCTKCAILVTGGFPFEEKSIGGLGSKTCMKCGFKSDKKPGVDVHLVDVSEGCKCAACSPQVLLNSRMIVCQVCGNKRCPRAAHHDNLCTNSNEPDQLVKPIL